MKQLIIVASVMFVFLMIGPFNIQAQQTGFYISLSRCVACSLTVRESKNAILAFRKAGIPAFYGTAKYNKTYDRVLSLKKETRYSGLSTLYVGPFQTNSQAQAALSKIPSILSKQIAEDQRENRRQVKEGYALPLSPEETTGFYDVEIIRVP